MNSSITEKEKIWDEFLARWPLEKLRQITLQEYTQAGGSDSFTYWLEAKTEKLGSIRLGSIWGGSSFKFGIYSLRNQSDKEDGAGKSYSTEYGWCNKYGATAEEAFEQVRAIVVEIANAARVGNLALIQQANLGFAVKWKIAFLYQNRNQPCILPIYDLKHLRAAAGHAFNKLNHAELYSHLMKDCSEKSVITYGVQLWEKAVTVLESEKSNLPAREKIARHFFSHERFRECWENAWEWETRELFIDYAITIHNAGLDWWFQNSTGYLCFGRKNQDDNHGTNVGFLNLKKSGLDVKRNAIGGHDEQYQPISQKAIDFWQSDELLALASDLYPSSRAGYWPDAYSSIVTSPTTGKNTSEINNISLNTILFGPPGTGKTYATIDAALEIIDPEFLKSHQVMPDADLESRRAQREALKQHFDKLSKDGRIRFVTFHQSFSYEDFVEGIRGLPPTEEDEQNSSGIQYQVEKGIFGQLCEDAQRNKVYEEQIGVRENAKVWKISIEEANSSGETRQYCFKHGEARIGWSNVKDIRKANLADPAFKLGSNDQSSLANFGRDIVPGDVLVCLGTISQICAVGVVTGEYEYNAQVPEGVRSDYVHRLPVKWLATDFKFDITELNQGIGLTLKTVYLLKRIKWPALQEALHRANIV